VRGSGGQSALWAWDLYGTVMKSAEDLAKEYLATLPLGSYGKEYDAFLAGYIACLRNWEQSPLDQPITSKKELDAAE